MDYIYYPNELYHYGVKGQHWGNRRYQEYSGKNTPLGLERRRKGTGRAHKQDTTELHGVTLTKPSSRSDNTLDRDRLSTIATAAAFVTATAVKAGTAIKNTADAYGVTPQELAKHVDWGKLALDIASGNPRLTIIGGLAAGMAAKYVSEALVSVGKVKMSELSKKKSEKDEATGLALKKEPTSKRSDLKAVNPGYGNFMNNTKKNCALCSVAYDMRRRGYNVTANTASRGYTVEEIRKFYKNAKVEIYKVNNPREGSKYIANEILKQGDGARGIVASAWTQGGGHAYNYEVENGTVKLYDSQCGKIYNPDRYFSQSSRISFMRTDNINFNDKTIKECVN